jgi:hypothetical protein
MDGLSDLWANQDSAASATRTFPKTKTGQSEQYMKTSSFPKARTATAALALLAFGLASVCHADPKIKTELKIPTTIKATFNSSCDNSSGPSVTLDGSIQMSGFKEKFIFKNNKRGNRTTNMISAHDVTLIPLVGAITLPKQPSQGGIGGNPYLYVVFRDTAGSNLTEEVLLGRCVQGFSIEAEVVSKLMASSDVSIGDCKNKQGPEITVDCDITISGLNATLIFRNNPKGTHTAEVVTDVTLIIEGSTMKIPKRKIHGGVGRNPIVGMQFLHDDDAPMSEPVTFGRCNKL